MPNNSRVVTGKRAKLTPSMLNAMMDAAQSHRDDNFGGSSAGKQKLAEQAGIVVIQNSTGGDLAQGAVVALTALLTSPQTGEDHRAYAFTGSTPSAGYEQKFAVLQEPIANNAFGHAMIVGLTPVQISRPIGDTSQTCGMLAGQTYLQTGLTGAQILWENPSYVGAAVHTAFVSIPTGGAAASPSSIVVVDRVPTATDGAAGSITTNGAQSVDGSNATNNSLVLLRLQATAADRGIWKVNTGGAWTKSTPFQPSLVPVANGATLQDTEWYLSAVNTWRGVVGVYA